jgi:hypothetical protein
MDTMRTHSQRALESSWTVIRIDRLDFLVYILASMPLGVSRSYSFLFFKNPKIKPSDYSKIEKINLKFKRNI